MIMDRCPLLCGDEISTGLDAASTYDIVDVMTYYGRLQRTCRVIALLQPSPETVALFDDVLVMADGKMLYAGPIGDVENYFENIGYAPPDSMDVAGMSDRPGQRLASLDLLSVLILANWAFRLSPAIIDTGCSGAVDTARG